MRFLTKLFAAATFCLMAATAGASPANPENGKDYRTLDKAQTTESGNKVEVIEFFWYSCPHCNFFEPALSEWVKKQGDKIVFKRVPVLFRESMEPQQRLYYALEAMGKAEEMQKKIFRAIHVDRAQLDTKEQIADFIAKQGIDKQKFLDLYNSFGVQTKVNRVPALQQDYRIEGVPTIAIAGRYVTSPSIISTGNGNQAEATLHESTVKVMDYLVAKAAKESGAAAQKPAASADVKKKK
ncbi:MAG: thiol:disulfide interchange protein DsbA/DsbL [Burkholderiales bacterium]|nr:thiol:disulfide interchange protein DsbA/DsbL [Burkholderiales bacterium]